VADVQKSKHKALNDNQTKLQGLDKLDLPRSEIPAVTHVDHSARVQTVDGKHNPRFYALLKSFKAKTKCGVLVNTSFNVRGEPIVCTPEDAFRCFMGTHMDVLVVGNFYMAKDQQNPALLEDYSEMFELD